MKKDNKKGEKISSKFLILIFLVIVLLISFIIVGFVIFGNRDPDIVEVSENGGGVKLVYAKNSSSLSIKDAVPTTDLIGKKTLDENKYFDFSVETELDNAKTVEYEISVTKLNKLSTIPDSEIKIYLEKEDRGTYVSVFGPDKYKGISEKSELGSKKGSMILTSVIRKKSGTDNYRLRIWHSDTSLLTTGDYSVEVNVNGIAK